MTVEDIVRNPARGHDDGIADVASLLNSSSAPIDALVVLVDVVHRPGRRYDRASGPLMFSSAGGENRPSYLKLCGRRFNLAIRS
jgi:hypothetical protein